MGMMQLDTGKERNRKTSVRYQGLSKGSQKVKKEKMFNYAKTGFTLLAII